MLPTRPPSWKILKNVLLEFLLPTYFVKHLNLHAKGKYPTFVVGFYFHEKETLETL